MTGALGRAMERVGIPASETRSVVEAIAWDEVGEGEGALVAAVREAARNRPGLVAGIDAAEHGEALSPGPT